MGETVENRQAQDPLLVEAEVLEFRGGTARVLAEFEAAPLAGAVGGGWAEVLAIPARPGGTRGIGGAGHVVVADGLHAGDASEAASAVDEATPGDHGDEGHFAGHRGVEAGCGAPEIDEDLMDGVLGVGVVRGEASGQAPDQGGIALDEGLHGGLVASGDALEQRGLGAAAVGGGGAGGQSWGLCWACGGHRCWGGVGMVAEDVGTCEGGNGYNAKIKPAIASPTISTVHAGSDQATGLSFTAK